MQRPVVILAVALTLSQAAACTDASTAPLEGPPAARAARAASSPVVARTEGMGRLDLRSAGVSPATFSFWAARRADGSVAGVFRQTRESGGLLVDFSGAVTCLAVDPVTRRAWIGGVITRNRSTAPAFLDPTLHMPGMDVWFRVADYGALPAAPGDRGTVYGFRGSSGIITSAEYCAAMPWPDLDARTFPVVGGSLIVR